MHPILLLLLAACGVLLLWGRRPLHPFILAVLVTAVCFAPLLLVEWFPLLIPTVFSHYTLAYAGCAAFLLEGVGPLVLRKAVCVKGQASALKWTGIVMAVAIGNLNAFHPQSELLRALVLALFFLHIFRYHWLIRHLPPEAALNRYLRRKSQPPGAFAFPSLDGARAASAAPAAQARWEASGSLGGAAPPASAFTGAWAHPAYPAREVKRVPPPARVRPWALVLGVLGAALALLIVWAVRFNLSLPYSIPAAAASQPAALPSPGNAASSPPAAAETVYTAIQYYEQLQDHVGEYVVCIGEYDANLPLESTGYTQTGKAVNTGVSFYLRLRDNPGYGALVYAMCDAADLPPELEQGDALQVKGQLQFILPPDPPQGRQGDVPVLTADSLEAVEPLLQAPRALLGNPSGPPAV